MELQLEQPFCKNIFATKYMINGEKTSDEVFRGAARVMASVEKTKRKRLFWEEVYYQAMVQRKFIPGGRILANARPHSKLNNYGNCYVIGINDSLQDIYRALNDDATISAAGGGVGFNVSNLRPRDASISRGGESSGPLSFLDVFDASAKTIRNGGGRRSAHIAIMDVSHPDIEEFITYKQGDHNKKLTSFNISVGISQEFIDAWKNDTDWNLTFGGKVYKTVRARELMEKLARHAFFYNEPGLLFYPAVDKRNFGYYIEQIGNIRSTNPCGEIPLPIYGICNLSAINLSQLVIDPFSETAEFDWNQFEYLVGVAVRFSDNVIDAMEYPLPQIEDLQKKTRRIGLGITGLADAFAMLGMQYGSDQSVNFTETLSYLLRQYSVRASTILAKEKGRYKLFDYNKYIKTPFWDTISAENQKLIKKHGMRNIALNTTAPTGTTSIAVGMNCSSGVEPIFSIEYERTVRVGEEGETTTEVIYDYAALLARSLGKEFNAKTIESIDPHDAMRVQAALQKYLDNSISKTYNLPKNYTYEEYEKLLFAAFDSGLVGFTSFNPNGHLAPVLATRKEAEAPIESSSQRLAPKRPKELPCDIHTITSKGQKYLFLIGLLDDQPYEVFATEYNGDLSDVRKYSKGLIRKLKRGHYQLVVQNGEESVIIDNISQIFNSDYEAVNRLMSLLLRHGGIPLHFLVDQLGKAGHFGTWGKTIAMLLKKYIKDGTVVGGHVCPNCGSEDLIYQEGCLTCRSCGHSKCG